MVISEEVIGRGLTTVGSFDRTTVGFRGARPDLTQTLCMLLAVNVIVLAKHDCFAS